VTIFSWRKLALLTLAALMFLPLAPASASTQGPPPARGGGIVIYEDGEHIYRAGPLPDSLKDLPELSGYEAGYRCKVLGVFWSEFSVKDCKPVAYNDAKRRYTDETEVAEAVAAAYPDSAMERGFWSRYGWMLMLGTFVVLGLFYLVSLFTGSDEDEEDMEATTR
jgi:hypothetical protein